MNFKYLAVTALFVASISGAQQLAKQAPDNHDILARSRDVIKQAVQQGSVEDPDAEAENIDLAHRIANQAVQKAAKVSASDKKLFSKIPSIGEIQPNLMQSNVQEPVSSKSGYHIFVSDAMSDDELTGAFEVAVDNDATVYYRGILPGATIQKSFIRPHKLAQKIRKNPRIELDPRPFDHFGVSTVPTMVLYDGTNFVKVSGTLSAKYLKARYDRREFGDAGARGTTVSISEKDFIQEMKDRLMKIDFAEEKKQAIGRIWKNMEIQNLPRSDVSSVTYFDPTVINVDEITDPNGRVIAPAGSSYNPLDLVNFDRILIAFDATDPKQLAFAKKTAASELKANRVVVLLTSNVDRERGFEAYAEYSAAVFPNRVYVLDKFLADRFGITTTPSVIRPEGRLFRIDHIAYKDL